MPEELTDAQIRELMTLRTRAKKLNLTGTGKNERSTLLVQLRAYFANWNVIHLQWEAAKRVAKGEGINTGVFHHNLGRQVDDLIQTTKNAELIVQQYGELRQNGVDAIRQRYNRILQTITDYIVICRQHGQKLKRTQREALAWRYLETLLESSSEQVKGMKPTIDRLAGGR